MCQPMSSPRRLDLVCKHLILLDRKGSSPAFRELAKTQSAFLPKRRRALPGEQHLGKDQIKR